MSILSLLAHNSYIMYNKQLAKSIGIDEAILFGSLCGFQAMFNGAEEFYCEQQRIMDDTCLTEYRLLNALRNLKNLGLVNVVKKGMPAKNYYQLNENKLFEVLHVTSDPKFKVTGGIKNEVTSDPKIDTTLNNNQINNKKNNNKQEYIQEGDNCPPTCPPQEKKEVEVLIEHPILTYWNSKKIIVHSPSNTINKAIAKALKEFSEEEIKLYIDRYVKVINDPLYGFKYVWTLAQFLTQKNAMSDFTDEGSKWVNYLNNQNKRVQSLKPKKGSTQPSILDLDFNIEE